MKPKSPPIDIPARAAESRVAAALRDNLRKRKAQSWLREAQNSRAQEKAQQEARGDKPAKAN